MFNPQRLVLGRKRRKVILLELIRRKPLGWRRLIYPVWFRIIARPSVRRAMRTGQVLTEWEKQKNAELFGVPLERLESIPWPLSAEGDELPPFDSKPENDMVLSSGRAVSDWETLFRAAEGRQWASSEEAVDGDSGNGVTVRAGAKIRQGDSRNRGAKAEGP